LRDRHLSIETLAHLLAGDLDHESLTGEVIPHLLAHCSTCRESYREILELQKEVGHWDERVAVFEGRQAVELYALLEPLAFDEQLGRVLDDESFQTWGLCRLLLKRSLEQAHAEPGHAVQLAELGVRIAERLGDVYDPSWVRDLRARALATLGNARRVIGELHGAEIAFLEAERVAAESSSGNPEVRAEQLHLKASLRRDQRRLDEALSLIEQAIALYAETDSHEAAIRAQLKKAQIQEEAGELLAAVETLRAAERPLAEHGSPEMRMWVGNSLILCLVGLERYDEARELFRQVEEESRQAGQPLDRLRLRWVEGKIAAGLGEEPAEALLREVSRDFARRGLPCDAALVALDLAILFAEARRFEELKQLSGELRSLFEAFAVSREAFGALLLFELACREERATANLARQVILLLERGGRRGC
jgi:tetratricopeptide (TPR) repeat protein